MEETTTDEEICQAVLDAWKAEEEGKINGGDDDVDDNVAVEACPTHRKILQAASVINSHIGGHSVNDSITCKMEAILSSFRYQMHLEESHSVTSTCLTNYFSHR